MTEQIHNYKKIFFIEDVYDIEKLNVEKINLEENKIFTLSNDAHISLKQKNISHNIGELFITSNDQNIIFEQSVKLKKWYDEFKIPENLYFNGINILGVYDHNESYHLFLECLQKLVYVKRILENCTYKKIICSESLKDFFKTIPEISNNSIETFQKTTSSKSYFDKYQINIKFGRIPLSLEVKRNRLNQIRKWYEKGLLLQNLSFKGSTKNSILLLEFDPVTYEKLLKQLRNQNIDIILLNTRKSAIYNYKSLSIVKKYGCKIINQSEFINTHKNEISKKTEFFKNQLKKFWSNDELFTNLFVFENCRFWNIIKKYLSVIYESRIEEYLKLIILSKNILEKNNFNSIVSLYTNSESENVILKINNNRIPHVLLEHGYANFTNEVSKFDIFHMYDSFNDKIAVWGKIQNNYLTKVKNIEQNRIIQVGSPRHDALFELEKKPSRKKENQVLILPSPLVNYSGLTNTETFERYESLVKKLLQILSDLKMEVIVKLHPTQDSSVDFIKQIFQNFDKTIPIFQSTSLLNHLKSANTVIHIEPHGVGLSTSILESLILGIPTMNIIIKNKIYEFECVKDNSILSVHDSDDIEKSVSNILLNQSFRQNLVKNSKNHIANYLVNPGTASQKFAEILKSIN